MLAPIESKGVVATPASSETGTARIAVQPPPTTGNSGVRTATPHDALFLTVEPDGRDDISFLDRLRHALRAVFEAVQRPDEAAAAAERAVEAARQSLTEAAAGTEGFFAQIRIVGVETAYTDDGKAGGDSYASYRRLGVEIGIARGGAVRAEDTSVVGLDGRSFGLTAQQTRSGLSSGTYRVAEPSQPAPSGQASERLAAAQSGLARVKAIQDALKAYRSGDLDPLKKLLVDGSDPAGGRFGAVFPGIGALSIN